MQFRKNWKTLISHFLGTSKKFVLKHNNSPGEENYEERKAEWGLQGKEEEPGEEGEEE